MSRPLKIICTLSLVLVAAACARNNEEEVVIVEPISSEPVHTGKYK